MSELKIDNNEITTEHEFHAEPILVLTETLKNDEDVNVINGDAQAQQVNESVPEAAAAVAATTEKKKHKHRHHHHHQHYQQQQQQPFFQQQPLPFQQQPLPIQHHYRHPQQNNWMLVKNSLPQFSSRLQPQINVTHVTVPPSSHQVKHRSKHQQKQEQQQQQKQEQQNQQPQQESQQELQPETQNQEKQESEEQHNATQEQQQQVSSQKRQHSARRHYDYILDAPLGLPQAQLPYGGVQGGIYYGAPYRQGGISAIDQGATAYRIANRQPIYGGGAIPPPPQPQQQISYNQPRIKQSNAQIGTNYQSAHFGAGFQRGGYF